MEPTTSTQPSQPDAGAASAAGNVPHRPATDSALTIAESWLDTVAHATGGVWWMTDTEGLVAGQQSLSAYTGAPADAFTGAGWLTALAPVDRPAARERWRAAASKTFTAPVEAFGATWRFVRPGARIEWLAVQMQPVAVAPGEPPRWLWVAGQSTQERAVRNIGLYRSLFEQTAQGLVMVGGKGTPIRANAAALSMLGLTLAQARGDVALPAGWQMEREDGARIAAPFVEAASTASGQTAQVYWQVRADGWPAERWLSVTASLIHRSTSAESRARTLIFLTDLTDRVHRRQAIQSVAAKSADELTALRAALDRMTDAFVVLDYEGRFTYVNARAREQFAPGDETLLGRRFWEVFPALAGSAMEAEYQRVLRELTPSVIETEVGEGVWLEVRSYPAPDGISVYIRDISSHKRTMAELDAALARERDARAEAEQRAQQLDAVFEAVSDGMVVFGPDGAALRANQAMRNLMAVLGQRLTLPLSADEFTALMSRNEPDAQQTAASAGLHLRRILGGESLTGERMVDLVLRIPNAHNLYLNVSGAPIHGSDGRILGAVESLRDVTADREAERERSRTLSLVAHELRTPLTAIKLSIDLSLRRARRDLSIEPDTLDVAFSSCLQLERMVSDLVDAAHAERKNMVMAFGHCDARELAAQAVVEQQTTTDKPIIIASPMAPQPVVADPARIRQVLSNLISNAVKYSPPDTGVTLRIERRDGSVWFGVSDEGPGVPAEAIPHLFDAFFRAPDVVSLTGPNVGLGLGLFLCKRIVDEHGGQIGMQNGPERGSLFWFTLPLATTDNAL
ncbi:MAG TPA: PAS domain-containing protein [Ktedonobacterales bacterium]